MTERTDMDTAEQVREACVKECELISHGYNERRGFGNWDSPHQRELRAAIQSADKCKNAIRNLDLSKITGES